MENEVNPVKVTPEQNKNKKTNLNLRYQRDKDRESVKGIFRFYEIPGGTLSFVYKAYKPDPVEKYTLVDGQIYTLPLGVAKHLNKNGWYPIHEYMKDENDKPSIRIGQKVRRFGFQSLEFVDVDEISTAPSEIVTVEHITPIVNDGKN
ncbi:MAG: hypothetical protein PHS34_08290 [Candidatus Omnitrophica bacterium]|nr:hypothetical protein [Candidatus Omnitrophota bacterium]